MHAGGINDEQQHISDIVCLKIYRTNFSNEAVAVLSCTGLCVSLCHCEPLRVALSTVVCFPGLFAIPGCLQQKAAAARRCGAELFTQAREG